jgi:hypothetical protein
MPKPPQRPVDPRQRWMTFVRNHAKAIIACDFFVVETAAFQLIYIFLIWKSVHEGFFISMSRATRRPIGRYSSLENALPAMKDTGF